MDTNSETDLLAFRGGSKILIDSLTTAIGGGGTNTAAAFSKLGLKTAFAGKVGSGHNSDYILDTLKKSHIDTRLVTKVNGKSGFSIILDNSEKDRVILAHKGVNDTITIKDIPLSKLKTRWIYSSSLIGKSYETLVKVSKYSKKKGITFAFNPSSYMTEQGIAYLAPVLENTNILIFNKEEALSLTGKTEMLEVFSKIHSIGPKLIVITLGKNGVVASDTKFIYQMAATKTDVVDATGAGDAFAASFVTGQILGKDIEFSLKLGIVNATSVLKQIGAKEGLLNYSKAIKEIRKNKNKVIKEKINGRHTDNFWKPIEEKL